MAGGPSMKLSLHLESPVLTSDELEQLRSLLVRFKEEYFDLFNDPDDLSVFEMIAHVDAALAR